MNTVFNQFGRTIWYAILFIIAVTLITAGSYVGEVYILDNLNKDNAVIIDTSKDAFSQEGDYIDTAKSKDLMVKPTITLETMPELNNTYNLQDILKIRESNGKEINDFYVVSISDESMQSVDSNVNPNIPVSNDAIADNKVTLNKQSNTLTRIKFNKQGTYRLNLRINGSVVSRKSYVLTVR